MLNTRMHSTDDENASLVLWHNIPMACMTYDMNFIIKFWNHKATDLLGYETNEAMGNSVMDLIIPECQLDNEEVLLNKISEYGQLVSYNHVLLGKGGSKLICHCFASIIRDGTSGEKRILLLLEEAYNAESNTIAFDPILKTSETLSNAEFNLVYKHSNQHIEYLNPSFTDLLSKIMLEDITMVNNFIHLISYDDRLRLLRNYLNTTRAKKTEICFRFKILLNDHSSADVQLKGSVLYFADDFMFVLRGKLNILSEKEKAEEIPDPWDERNISAAELREIGKSENRNYNELLGEITNGVIHNLNQPLGLLRVIAENMTQAASAGKITPEYVQAKCNTVSENVAKISNLMGEMEILNKDLHEWNMTGVDINACLEGLLKLYNSTLAIDDIKLIIKQPEKVPFMIGHDRWLHIILLNLLSNAKYAVNKKERIMPDTDYQKEISFKTSFDQDSIYIEVLDNGMGIKSKHKGFVFLPHFTTKGIKGTGMGLSIVVKYVLKMGGRITFDSVYKEYTHFKIRFPRLH